jgi:hypothetical protein
MSGQALFTVTVDYDQPLLTVVGKRRYDRYFSPNLTDEAFPPSYAGSKEFTMVLLRLGSVSTDNALEEAKRRQMRLAGPRELIAFDEAYPKELKYPIIALGESMSLPGSPPLYASLWLVDYERIVDLRSCPGRWPDSCSFLAVMDS